jgi:hypothetical protein
MALDIVLTVGGQTPRYNSETSISFEGGAADYWYLWPTMIKEIQNKTGELIDLYDDAEFSGDNLEKVAEIVLNQLEKLKQKKDKEWEVHTGAELQPIKKEIYRTLIKKDLEDKLQRLLIIVQQAKQDNEKVICIGD